MRAGPAPYLTLWVHTDGGDDRLIFEPPYAGQGNVALGQWQTWDALGASAGWYDDNASGGSGPGSASMSLANLLASMTTAGYKNAAIYNPAGALSSLGGVRIAAGFVNADQVTNTNLDNFTIGTSDGVTTYDFEPSAAVPEPASLIAGATAAAWGLGAWLRRRRHAA